MADKSSIRSGIEFAATAIGVVGAFWAAKTYAENWMTSRIEQAVEDKILIIEKLQLAELLLGYDYPNEAISELRLLADNMKDLSADDERKIAYYDSYLAAVADSRDTLGFEPEIRMLKAVFSDEMSTDGWHDEQLAFVSMFLPEARSSGAFFEREVIGRLSLAAHQYDYDDDLEGMESAYRTLALAYLCVGETQAASEAIDVASMLQPITYFLDYPVIGIDVIAKDRDIAKLNSVCAYDVPAGFTDVLKTLSSEENPIRDLVREYIE